MVFSPNSCIWNHGLVLLKIMPCIHPSRITLNPFIGWLHQGHINDKQIIKRPKPVGWYHALKFLLPISWSIKALVITIATIRYCKWSVKKKTGKGPHSTTREVTNCRLDGSMDIIFLTTYNRFHHIRNSNRLVSYGRKILTTNSFKRINNHQ